MSRRGGPAYHEPICHCPDCAAGLFPPPPALRAGGGYSPAVLSRTDRYRRRARLDSFADAAFAVGLTGLSISPRRGN